MLDYLRGATSGVPPMGQPGTMPGAAPQAGTLPADVMGAIQPVGPAGDPPPGLMPPGSPDPGEQYKTVAQADGTLLIHLVNPDGSLGPAVKIVSVPRPKGAGQGQPMA